MFVSVFFLSSIYLTLKCDVNQCNCVYLCSLSLDFHFFFYVILFFSPLSGKTEVITATNKVQLCDRRRSDFLVVFISLVMAQEQVGNRGFGSLLTCNFANFNAAFCSLLD